MGKNIKTIQEIHFFSTKIQDYLTKFLYALNKDLVGLVQFWRGGKHNQDNMLVLLL